MDMVFRLHVYGYIIQFVHFMDMVPNLHVYGYIVQLVIASRLLCNDMVIILYFQLVIDTQLYSQFVIASKFLGNEMVILSAYINYYWCLIWYGMPLVSNSLVYTRIINSCCEHIRRRGIFTGSDIISLSRIYASLYP